MFSTIIINSVFIKSYITTTTICFTVWNRQTQGAILSLGTELGHTLLGHTFWKGAVVRILDHRISLELCAVLFLLEKDLVSNQFLDGLLSEGIVA